VTALGCGLSPRRVTTVAGDDLLDVYGVAYLLGVSPNVVYRLMNDGMLPVSGRPRQVRRADVEAYLQECQIRPVASQFDLERASYGSGTSAVAPAQRTPAACRAISDRCLRVNLSGLALASFLPRNRRSATAAEFPLLAESGRRSSVATAGAIGGTLRSLRERVGK